MANWIFLALISGLLYGGYHFFIKLASAQIHQVLAAIILQFTALAVGGALLMLMKASGQSINYSSKGILFAMLGGVSVGLAEILAFYVFSHGAPVSQAVPVIVGVTIAAAGVYGIAFLGESIALLQVLGALLIITGIALLRWSAG